MSKVLKLIFLIFCFFSISSVFGYDNLNIISREEWGANESYRYVDGPEWQEIFKAREEAAKENEGIELTDKQKLEIEKNKIADNFLVNTYPEIFEKTGREDYDGEYKLARPLTKTNKTSIIVHHTDGKYDDSYDAVRRIYKYHALTKKWGDIGYNYLIGLDGEIFEGRAGGDDVVGSHTKWNNHSTIGIALIGSYSTNDTNNKQEESLKKLVDYLTLKYNIDYSKKVPFFRWCIGSDACNTKPIEVLYDYPLIGHRDAGRTSCPGDKLYQKLLSIKQSYVDSDLLFKLKLKKINDDKLYEILLIIEDRLDKTKNEKNILLLNKYKYSILSVFSDRKTNLFTQSKESFDDNNKIKVKLSYPKKEDISFAIEGKIVPKLVIKGNEYILNFLPGTKFKKYKVNVEFKNDNLFLNNRQIGNFNKNNFFRVKSPINNYITISSWDRIPKWDKEGKYNDNKFRGDIVLYNKEEKLVVVNDIILNDYLKGLGEVSNNTNKEKIKSIIVLARTYARWYMTQARKFEGEWYDASDDPNVFQKYLGYSLEQRSPNINKIVDETKDIVVTYNGKLIKPWYFSKSNGKTKDFMEYCKTAKGVPDCKNPENFPFLSGTKDPGGNGNGYLGHGIGVPGTGVEYFSQRNWDYSTIIRYFLKGVDVNYL